MKNVIYKLGIYILFSLSFLLLVSCSTSSKRNINFYFVNDNEYFKQVVYKKEMKIENNKISDDNLLDFLASYFCHLETNYISYEGELRESDDYTNPQLSFKANKNKISYEKAFIYSDEKLENLISKDDISNYNDIYIYYYHPLLNGISNKGINSLITYIREPYGYDTDKILPNNILTIKDYSQIIYYVNVDDNVNNKTLIDLFNNYLKVENVKYNNQEINNDIFKMDFTNQSFEIYKASFNFENNEYVNTSTANNQINISKDLLDSYFVNEGKGIYSRYYKKISFYLTIADSLFSAYNDYMMIYDLCVKDSSYSYLINH